MISRFVCDYYEVRKFGKYGEKWIVENLNNSNDNLNLHCTLYIKFEDDQEQNWVISNEKKLKKNWDLRTYKSSCIVHMSLTLMLIESLEQYTP